MFDIKVKIYSLIKYTELRYQEFSENVSLIEDPFEK